MMGGGFVCVFFLVLYLFVLVAFNVRSFQWHFFYFRGCFQSDRLFLVISHHLI